MENIVKLNSRKVLLYPRMDVGERRWLLSKWEDGDAYVQFIKIWRKRGNNLLTAFEVVQTLLSFGGFTIALIGLCYKFFKDDKK